MNGAVLKWFESYLIGRACSRQQVWIGFRLFSYCVLCCMEMPQGLFFNPMLFLQYIAEILWELEHLYAIDTNICKFCAHVKRGRYRTIPWHVLTKAAKHIAMYCPDQSQEKHHSASYFVSCILFLYFRIEFAVTDCGQKNGTFGALEMLTSSRVDVVFGPFCSTGLYFSSATTLFG